MRKNFSFDDQTDQDILKYLETVGNMSDYIRKLIRQDMKGEYITKTEAVELIEQYMKQPKSNSQEAARKMFG